MDLEAVAIRRAEADAPAGDAMDTATDAATSNQCGNSENDF
jgi:hypothetical protein